MTTASLSELRRALKNIPVSDLSDLCIRLARYKKENKELLSYLLFDVGDEPEYIKGVKAEIDKHFIELSGTTPYMTKKGIRKALTFTNQRIRCSGQKRTEVELLIYFTKKFKKEISFRNNLTLKNIYLRQILRIKKTLATLHEDLQFDFGEEVRLLE